MIVVLMGVAGCGKTTVGQMLARNLGWRYFDADDYHPAANVEKMRAGIPLRDADRWPWLDSLNALLRDHLGTGQNVVLGCSALKQTYRERLASGLPDLYWVHLTGSFELILSRLQARKGHYMPASLLQSQFEALEAPLEALQVDISDPPEVLVSRIVAHLPLEHEGKR